MSSLKEKIINKKVLLILIILAVIILVFAKFIGTSLEDAKNKKIESKSGFTNIFAPSSSSSIKGNENGVEEFLRLAENKSIKFESENLENCYNITPEFVSSNSDYKIFKFKDTAETYIVYEELIYKIGNNKRARGITSFALADINQDEKLELFYTYVWKVSEKSRSNISYFDPLEKKEVGINKNYIEENVILIKNENELTICNAAFSKDTDNIDFILNSKLEIDVLVNDNDIIKPLRRVEFEEIFAAEKNK